MPTSTIGSAIRICGQVDGGFFHLMAVEIPFVIVTFSSIWNSRTGSAHFVPVTGCWRRAAQKLIRDYGVRSWHTARESSASATVLRETEIIKKEENNFTELMELYDVAQPV